MRGGGLGRALLWYSFVCCITGPRIDKMAGFLKSAMILEDYRGHGSGTLVLVFLYFIVEALISGPGWGFSYWGFPHL